MIKTLCAGLVAALSALALVACGPSPSQSAYVPPPVVATAPAPAAVPVSPYVVDPAVGCPVVGPELRNVLLGTYGVDDLYRPINAYGFAIDQVGNCVTAAPVANVYHARPAPLYINQLYVLYPTYYPRSWVWVAPVYVVSPRLHVITTVPTGRAPVVVNTYRAPAAMSRTTVTVPAGATTTVRPGAPAAVTTVTGGATTVRPGAVAAPAPARVAPAPAPAPARIAPAAAPAQTTAPSAFNRGPAAAPSQYRAPAAAPAPTRIAPSSTGSTSSSFRRGR